MAPVDSRTPTVIPFASDWDEAYSRVESYLRAHQIRNRILLSRMVGEIVKRAVETSGQNGSNPVTCAMELADQAMADWFDRVLGEGGGAHKRLSIKGRLALTMAEVPERWPEHFLGPDPLPGEMAESMRNCYLEAGPGFQFSNMVPRPIDLGPIASAAGGTWATFQKWPLIRGLFLWTVFLTGMVFLFYLTR